VNIAHLERWTQVWQAAGCAGGPRPCFDLLIAAYAEPQRHYHNLQHIEESLAIFDSARHLAHQPAAVEMAIWFHDAVYDPKASDNEERSAALGVKCLSQATAPHTFIETVHRLILVTKTHDAGSDTDACLLVDVDLSILGQPEPRFQEFEAQIRKEYAWVPTLIFAGKRSEILARFLQRDSIYHGSFFREKLEQQARRNLRASIAALRNYPAGGVTFYRA